MEAMKLTPSGLLLLIRECGLSVRVNGPDLLVTPADMVTPEMRDVLKRRKPELVDTLTHPCPEEPCERCGGRGFLRGWEEPWRCVHCDGPPDDPYHGFVGPDAWLTP